MRAKYLGDIPTRALKRRSNWRELTPSSDAAAPTSGESVGRTCCLIHQPIGTAPLQCQKRAFDLRQSGAFGQARQPEIAGRDDAIREFLHRHAEQFGGAARPKTDSQNARDAPAPAIVEDP